MELEREAAALTAALNAGVLRGWHRVGGISGGTSERCWMAGWGTYRVERHSELLNEGVEVLGSLPAILEETGHLFNMIKMQMGRIEGERKKKKKKRVFRENVAGDHSNPPGKLLLLCGSPATGTWRNPTKGQAQPRVSRYPKYLECLGYRIGLLFNPSSFCWGPALLEARSWGLWVTAPVKGTLLANMTVPSLPQFPHSRAGDDDMTPTRCYSSLILQ